MKKFTTKNGISEYGVQEAELSDIEILDKRAQALAQLPKEEQAEDEILRLVTFHSGEERYGVEITQVQEVQSLRPEAWSKVPCTPDFIVGVVNIRGRVFSLMDVGRFVGLPARPLTSASQVLIVRSGLGDKGEMELGFLTDDVPQVITVSQDDVRPSSTTISSKVQEYVAGVTVDMVIILDLPRLLNDPNIIIHEEVL